MDRKTRGGITESEFNMWRAVLAFSMIDNTLSLEKQKLLRPYLNTIPFSRTQIDILKSSLKTPQSVGALYHKITNPKDKGHFYGLVRDLAGHQIGTEMQVKVIPERGGFAAESWNDDFLTDAQQCSRLNTGYQQYAETDVIGFLKGSPTVRVSA